MYDSITLIKVCFAFLLFSKAKSIDFKINKEYDSYKIWNPFFYTRHLKRSNIKLLFYADVLRCYGSSPIEPTYSCCNNKIPAAWLYQGPYDLEWSSYEVCGGPKLTNLTSFSTNLTKDRDNYVSWMNCTVFAQTRIDEIKIKVYSANDKRTSLLWSYKLNNPCQHYAVADIIEKILNAKNCLAKQGNYLSMLNFTEIGNSFFGSSFFYGKYKMKVIVQSKKGNMICLVMNAIFTKKKALYERS